MPAPFKPLPEPEPAGAFLFSDDQMAEVTDQEKRGHYTPDRFERCRPKQFELCIKMLCDKYPKIEIAQALNVSEKTVCRVADRHADRITELEAHFSKKLRRIAWDQADRVERNPGIIPAQAIAQSVKYFFETAQLAEGRPTEIHEERHEVNIYDHWRRFVAGDEIGLTGEKLPPIDGELVHAPAAALPASNLAPSDLRSDVLAQPTQANGQPCSNFCHDSAAETPAKSREAPGGGVGARAGAGPRTETDSQKFLPNGDS